MNRRLELHKLLCDTLKSNNVYYQPPESVKIKYPAIIYYKSDIDNTFANNNVYNQKTLYEVTVIDKNPDSEVVKNVSNIKTCRYNRHYTSDNLNHDVFLIYY